MLKYKIDVIKEMKEKGFNTTRIRAEKIFSEGTLQHLRKGEPVGMATLNTICCILRCTLDDILEFKATPEEKIKYY